MIIQAHFESFLNGPVHFVRQMRRDFIRNAKFADPLVEKGVPDLVGGFLVQGTKFGDARVVVIEGRQVLGRGVLRKWAKDFHGHFSVWVDVLNLAF